MSVARALKEMGLAEPLLKDLNYCCKKLWI